MKIDIFNIDKFIKLNHCKEVTNPTFWSIGGIPTEDGLFSYKIFGQTESERKNIFGYIDLSGGYNANGTAKNYFIHPLVWVIITSRMRGLGEVLQGKKFAVIADKKIKVVPEDFPGAETGIDFVYDNFDNINWLNEIEEKEIDSIDKKARLKLLRSLKKEEFFISKWLVLPPFYRSENSTNRTMGDAINKLYKELISKTKTLKSGFSFALFGSENKLRIQSILKNLYLTTLSPISGKHLQPDGELKGSGKSSMLRKHLLGKTIDYTASNVITSHQVSDADSPDDVQVPFGYGAFPLATLLSLFEPFFVNSAVLYLEKKLYELSTNFSDIKRINMGQFSVSTVQKLIKKFIKTQSERFSPILFKYTDTDNKVKEVSIKIKEYKTLNDVKKNNFFVNRDLTLMDLFYLIGIDVLKNKHVFVTRYPIANFQNIYPSKINILTTAKTHDVYVKKGENSYAHSKTYPLIPCEERPVSKVDSKFYDVLIPGNIYLPSLNGDYDGDMLYLKAVFSNEANKEAERLIYSKTNLLGANGFPSRGLSLLGKEFPLGLYQLTKNF